MASTYTNPMNAMSYTNKDFQTIYPELLDAAKELARNWDPTISNESDPGVVLLKLNAIIADKNNYNIDKNILENYPETYTQEFSARSQYKQLGYKMPWYRAAEVNVAFKYVPKEGEEIAEGESMTIPAFTSVSDTDCNYVYTILSDIVFNASTTNMIVEKEAIQGQLVDLSINGSNKIVLAHLDSRNRVYVDDYNIAQNGIFVRSSDSTAGYYWEQVENVEVQPSNSACYEFDIDPMTGTPYIQFRQDVRNVIGSGLYISYIVTEGASGAIISKTLSKFESSVTATKKSLEGEKNITLDEENMKITNYNSSTKGFDPETVEEAYYSFKKHVHTFDTLVTLRDYINAIYNSDIVSNSIVTDRTTDIPAHYKVVTSNRNSITEIKDVVRTDESKTLFVKKGESEYEAVDVPLMDAFDLRLYLLGHAKPVRDMASYEDSFELDISASTKNSILTYLDDTKCIQHNFKDLPVDEIVLIQNVFPIRIKISPTYKLSPIQQREVQYNIQSALVKAMNSHEMTFGEEAIYQEILDIATSADDRIKLAILDDFDYVTYAMYIEETDDGSVVKMIPVSDFSRGKSGVVVSDELNKQFTGLRYVSSGDAPGFYKWDNASGMSKLYASKDILDRFRLEIISRNILAGSTPMFDHPGAFEPNLMMDIDTTASVETPGIYASLNISLENEKSYKLRKNEILTFTGPSFIAGNTFAGYAKYLTSPSFKGEDSGTRCMESNETYQLATDKDNGDKEWIVFISRGEGDDAPYDCYVYTTGAVIRPNFPLYSNKSFNPESDTYANDKDILDRFNALISDKVRDLTSSDPEVGIDPKKPIKFQVSEVGDLNIYFEFIQNKLLGVNMTSGSRQIEVCRLNQVKLTTKENNYFYVVSNDKQYRGNLEYYRLTLSKDTRDDDINSFSRVLGPDEFFIYTNSDQTMYEVLGQGTLIEYDYISTDGMTDESSGIYVKGDSLFLENLAIDTTDIELDGIQAFKNDSIQFVNSNDTMFVTEQIVYSFVDGDIVTVTSVSEEDGENKYLTIQDNKTVSIGGEYKVEYDTSAGSGKLPIFKLSNAYYNWRVSSALHVKMSRDEPMVLQATTANSRQVFGVPVDDIIYYVDYHEYPDSNGDPIEVYIKSTLSADKMGNGYTDLTYQSAIGGEPLNTILLVYTMKKDEEDKFLNARTGNVDVTFVGQSTKEFTTSLISKSKYLLSVVCKSDKEITVTAVYNNTVEQPLDSLGRTTDITYWLIDTTSNGRLLTKLKFSGEDTSIEIQPLVQVDPVVDYLDNDEIEFDKIVEAVQKLDSASLFKYNYMPEEDIVIRNPLQPLSFFESNHVYNPVCIPRAIIDDTYAEYVFVNNR